MVLSFVIPVHFLVKRIVMQKVLHFALFEKYIIKSVPKSQQNIILLYLRFAKLGIKSAQNEQISSDIRLKKFDLLYRQIFKPCALKNNLIAKLQQAFINEEFPVYDRQ